MIRQTPGGEQLRLFEITVTLEHAAIAWVTTGGLSILDRRCEARCDMKRVDVSSSLS